MKSEKARKTPVLKLRRLIPSFVAIGVFLTGILFLFVQDRAALTVDQAMFIICGLYALVCLLFLFFQLYAFIKAHLEYDEDVERIKYRVFEAEGMDYVEEEII